MKAGNLKLLQSYLDFIVEKNKVITQNIANRESVGYRRKDVDFAQFLEKEKSDAMKVNNPRHIATPINNEVDPVIHIKSTDEFDLDNGEINIENEMAELAKATLNFKFASKAVRGYFNKLQTVIKGGSMV